jgi:hypothetical protein
MLLGGISWASARGPGWENPGMISGIDRSNSAANFTAADYLMSNKPPYLGLIAGH